MVDIRVVPQEGRTETKYAVVIETPYEKYGPGFLYGVRLVGRGTSKMYGRWNRHGLPEVVNDVYVLWTTREDAEHLASLIRAMPLPPVIEGWDGYD